MDAEKSKILIAYFSHSGNTLIVAEELRVLTGGNLFEIKTAKPYPQDYDIVTDIAKKEQTANLRPPLIVTPADMSTYDVIILGYPNWWSTMPMAVFTFLEKFDFTGKRILPYCTHEGSGLGHSERDIARECPGAKVLPGLAIRGSRVRYAKEELKIWLRQNGLLD